LPTDKHIRRLNQLPTDTQHTPYWIKVALGYKLVFALI